MRKGCGGRALSVRSRTGLPGCSTPLSTLDPGFAFGEAGKFFEKSGIKEGHRSAPVAFVVVVLLTVERYTVPQSCRP